MKELWRTVRDCTGGGFKYLATIREIDSGYALSKAAEGFAGAREGLVLQTVDSLIPLANCLH